MSSLPPYLDLPPTPEEPRKPKSVPMAVLLALFLGPLGLFYPSPLGGLFMTFVCVILGIGSVGVGLLFAWPVCIIWAYVTASASHEASPPHPQA